MCHPLGRSEKFVFCDQAVEIRDGCNQLTGRSEKFVFCDQAVEIRDGCNQLARRLSAPWLYIATQREFHLPARSYLYERTESHRKLSFNLRMCRCWKLELENLVNPDSTENFVSCYRYLAKASWVIGGRWAPADQEGESVRSDALEGRHNCE